MEYNKELTHLLFIFPVFLPEKLVISYSAYKLKPFDL